MTPLSYSNLYAHFMDRQLLHPMRMVESREKDFALFEDIQDQSVKCLCHKDQVVQIQPAFMNRIARQL